VTQKITEYQDDYLPGKEGTMAGGSKHTLRIDPSGKVWSTGSSLTRFDPETNKFTHFPEIPNTYDVEIAKSGDAWFTEPFANKLGRVDANTMKVTIWALPTLNASPRRIAIDRDGILWISEFLGKMARFDPKTETFKEFTLGGPEPNPYAVGIDPEGNVWYNSHLQDVVGRLDPKTGKVTEYPFPHSEICMREFFLDDQNRMWYGSNPNNKVGYFYLADKDGAMQWGSK
jgi:virginiamycin B lyase